MNSKQFKVGQKVLWKRNNDYNFSEFLFSEEDELEVTITSISEVDRCYVETEKPKYTQLVYLENLHHLTTEFSKPSSKIELLGIRWSCDDGSLVADGVIIESHQQHFSKGDVITTSKILHHNVKERWFETLNTVYHY